MISYEEYIWGDKFKNTFEKNVKVSYSNIDFVKKCNQMSEIIITHNGDNSVNDENISHFLNLKYWFGQNVMTSDDRVIALPIGLENDYINGQPQRKKILYEKTKQNKKAKNLVYLNCSITTHKLDRQGAYDYFSTKKWCTTKQHGTLNYNSYVDDILDHHFSICPRGNGLDCHRNWEVLYANRYPIMKRYYGLEKLYSDLPVIFVDKWEEITEEFLLKKIQEFGTITFNFDKLKYSFWKYLIENKIKEL